MQKRSRSISYRLQKTSNSAKRVEILTEWANQWKFEHIDLIERNSDCSRAVKSSYGKKTRGFT